MKVIKTAIDLAIRGAPPAFLEPLHVGRPNIGDKDRYLQLVSSTLDRRWLTNDGPLVREFERKVAEYLGVKHVVAMCNGTIALEIAIRALGLTGEVIVPSYTFVATAHALYWQGITPVFADIDPSTHCLDPKAVRRAITPRTSGILGVHLWGNPAATAELTKISEEFGIKLIFDAAHAFGITQDKAMIGCNGHCEVFSFHATKFFNTLEGGAAVTNDDELAERMRLMRNFGFSGYDNVIYPGTNGKMVEACAAMGLVNLDFIDDIKTINRQNHQIYAQKLNDLPGLSLFDYAADEKNWQYVVVEVNDDFGVTRDQIVDALHAENILARKYFWPGIHKMKPYSDIFPLADKLLPQTNVVANRVIVLPTGSAVGESEINIVCSVFRSLSHDARKASK